MRRRILRWLNVIRKRYEAEEMMLDRISQLGLDADTTDELTSIVFDGLNHVVK